MNMNKIRRKKIQEIKDQIEALKTSLEDLRDEEQEYMDNMPENLQGSVRYDRAEEAVGGRTEACVGMMAPVSAVMDRLMTRKREVGYLVMGVTRLGQDIAQHCILSFTLLIGSL